MSHEARHNNVPQTESYQSNNIVNDCIWSPMPVQNTSASTYIYFVNIVFIDVMLCNECNYYTNSYCINMPTISLHYKTSMIRCVFNITSC